MKLLSGRTMAVLMIVFFTAWLAPVSFAAICPACGGKGQITCPACKGTGIAGYVNVHGQQGAYGCERCGGVKGSPVPGTPGYGTGKKGAGHITCPTCGGSGQVQGKQNQNNSSFFPLAAC